MKRIGYLYEKICEFDNINLAFKKAAKGKQYQSHVVQFKHNLNKNIRQIQQQLIFRNIPIGNYRFFKVYDPKPRDICAASFPEQILHHAIMNVCEPYLEAFAIDASYASRKKKGSHNALKKAKTLCGKYEWYLKLDIKKYFDSIDHMILIDLLARKFKDEKLLDLFSKIIQSYSIQPGKGLPIGSLISQHLANFYLGPFDHWIKETVCIKGYIRYMDDFLIFNHSQLLLKKQLESIHSYLKSRLDLRIKENSQLNRSKYGIPFLGYRVFSQKILLTPRSRNRFVEKMVLYEKNYLNGIWSAKELVQHMEPLFGFVCKADTHGFRSDILNRFGVWS